MAYVALYRKYRPETFEDVKGQEAVVTALRNQIRTGRIGHAYLFSGTRGTGKTSVAKVFAKAVNCEDPQDGSPCMQCGVCRRIAAGASLNVIEIDAASNNGVDNIRQIIEEVAYRPTEGKYKVYIIDEAHMLSAGAFNALLKTLEEPPSYVIFILATTEEWKIPATIMSRCQRYEFRRIETDVIADRLTELTQKSGAKADKDALSYIAKRAEGAMRDALSILDQCLAFSGERTLTLDDVLGILGTVDTAVFRRIAEGMRREDVREAVGAFREAVAGGRDISQLISDFIWYFRDILLLCAGGDAAIPLIDRTQDQISALREDARGYTAEEVSEKIRVLSDLSVQLKTAPNANVLCEVALIRMCRMHAAAPEGSVTYGDAYLARLAERIEALEERADAMYSAPQHIVPNITEEDSAPQEEELPPAPPAPEDLQRIARNWSSIVEKLPNGMHLAKVFLGEAIPKYDPLSGDMTLYAELTDSFWDAYTGSGDVEKMLSQIILRTEGVQAKVKITRKPDRKSADTGIKDIRAILSERIHMEIEEQ
ncbi:MAG: DNA polymerase III subunit gamma/tau [Lachnospiraceae bacterium]|nr:DNA polymerase III subunit gamma/tau [Lachnospiraceae bacterium]